MKTFSEFLQDELSSASILQWLCLKELGPEYINWDVSVLNEELEIYCENIPQINYDKVHAGAYILRNNGHYIYFEIFEKIGRCLNMYDPVFDSITPLEPRELYWAIIEIALLDPSLEEETYSEEIKQYIKEILTEASLLRAHPCIRHVLDWDIREKYNKTHRGLQQDFDDETSDFINNRIRRIEKEYLDGFGKELELKKELLPSFEWE